MAVYFLAVDCKNSIIPVWKGLLMIKNINIKFSYAKNLQTKLKNRRKLGKINPYEKNDIKS